MNKDNKYYNLIETLIKQNKRFIGNEQFLDEIIDDVINHANSIIQTIDDENVINEFLNKTVNTSIITVLKRINRPALNQSNAQQLIEKINSKKQPDSNINKEYIDNFINGNIEKTQNTQVSENTTESEYKQITYEELSDISDDNQFDIEFNDDKAEPIDNTLDIDSENNTDSHTTLLDESFKLFDNNETNKMDNDIIESNIVQQNEDIDDNLNEEQDKILDNALIYDIEQNNDASSPELENAQVQENDMLDLSFDEPNDIKESENDEHILDENYNAEDLSNLNEYDSSIDDSIEIDSVSDESDLSLEEFNIDSTLEAEDLNLATSDTILESTIDINDQNATILESVNEIHNSIYDILNYEQNPIAVSADNINIEGIIEGIKSLDLKHPELNILEIYKLRFKEFKEIEDISDTLNMDSDDVIKALNLMIDIV